MKIGLELEYWVVDESGQLTSADELMEAHESVTNEFVDSLIEIRVPPAEAETELRRTVQTILSTVLEVAKTHSKRLVPLGTPLTAHDLPIITERGHVLEEIYGEELQYAKNCAGTHAHFDKGNVTRQLNLLTALDPALALVNSSPYYDGKREASSSRASVYRLDSASRFSRYRDLWTYVDDVAEWEARIKTEYKVLKAISHEYDIDEETFRDYFEPENAVLTPVRLGSHTPTVEWRAPDTALPSQTIRLVSDMADLLRQTEDKDVVIGDGEYGVGTDAITVPRFAELRKLSASAIADGLHSDAVRSYLTALNFDLSQYRPITRQIEDDFGATITAEQACTLRLRYAERLEADVASLTAESQRQTRGEVL
jgi:hypothetical protein